MQSGHRGSPYKGPGVGSTPPGARFARGFSKLGQPLHLQLQVGKLGEIRVRLRARHVGGRDLVAGHRPGVGRGGPHWASLGDVGTAAPLPDVNSGWNR